MSLAPLLDDTHEAAYWMGFVLSDGSLSQRGRLRLGLSVKDEQHLEDLSRFLGCKKPRRARNSGYEYSHLAHMDSAGAREVRSRFCWHPQKTYHPPDRMPYEDVDLLRSFAIGCIDADGCIKFQSGGRRSSTIEVVAHSTWLPFYAEMADRLEGLGTVSLQDNGTGRRYLRWLVSKQQSVIDLLLFGEAAGLPTLARKWGQIDRNYNPRRYERADEMRDLIRDGHRTKYIADKMGVTMSAVSTMRRRMTENGKNVSGR